MHWSCQGKSLSRERTNFFGDSRYRQFVSRQLVPVQNGPTNQGDLARVRIIRVEVDAFILGGGTEGAFEMPGAAKRVISGQDHTRIRTMALAEKCLAVLLQTRQTVSERYTWLGERVS